MNANVEKWLKRKVKEGPYYLYKKEPIRYFAGWDRSTELPTQIYKDGFEYTVLWKHKDKVRIGKFKDGMYARYGVATWGVLSNPYRSVDLWSTRPGSVSENELQYMMKLSKDGEIDLPELNLRDLKDLKN